MSKIIATGIVEHAQRTGELVLIVIENAYFTASAPKSLKWPPGQRLGANSKGCGQSSASLILSLTSSNFSLMPPFAWSALPSATLLSSSVALPTASFAFPFALSAAAEILSSRPIAFPFDRADYVRPELRTVSCLCQRFADPRLGRAMTPHTLRAAAYAVEHGIDYPDNLRTVIAGTRRLADVIDYAEAYTTSPGVHGAVAGVISGIARGDSREETL